MQGPRNQCASRFPPGQIVDDLLWVNGLADRTSRPRRAHFLSVSLATGARSLDAIAGSAARSVALGQIVHIRGCVLIRKGLPILVISRLRPGSQRRPR